MTAMTRSGLSSPRGETTEWGLSELGLFTTKMVQWDPHGSPRLPFLKRENDELSQNRGFPIL